MRSKKLAMARRKKKAVPRNRKLYICSHARADERCCYAIQSIDLEGLLRCSCGFDEDTKQALECATCKSRREQGDSPSRDLRTRARLCDSIDEIPDLMGSGVFGSQILFLGGIEPPIGPDPKPSKRLFLFDIDDDDSKEKEIDEMLRRKCSLAKFQHGKIFPWLVELNGDLYAMGFHSMCYPGMSVSEVYRHRSKQWETLPEPLVDFHKTEMETFYSYAVTGNMMVVSKNNPTTQVIYFDADKGSWITRQPHVGFEGMPFAFSGEGLVVDLKEGENKEKVLFSFHEDSDVLAWRFRLTDNLDDSYIKPLNYVGIKMRMACLLDVRPAGDSCHRFVNLGDGKVCFIRAKSILIYESIPYIKEVRLIVVVFEFDYDSESQAFSSRILTTRTFTYKCHCPDSSVVHLLSCFVR